MPDYNSHKSQSKPNKIKNLRKNYYINIINKKKENNN
jgi:hypothetical protein